jgi:predicted P-loop ATPase
VRRCLHLKRSGRSCGAASLGPVRRVTESDDKIGNEIGKNGASAVNGHAPKVLVKASKPPQKASKPPASQPPRDRIKTPANWRRMLQKTPITNGGQTVWRTQTNIFNISLILTHHAAWRGCLLYDEFSDTIIKQRKIPGVIGLDAAPKHLGRWVDADTEATRVWFQAEESMTVGANDMGAAVVHTARQQARHPVREYLRSLRWDGTERLKTVLSDYFGAEDSPYARGVARCWFISAIARVMKPGCQADYALVLESPQGWGKNRALRHLMPAGKGNWFSDTGITLGNKDSYQNLHGVWVYCLDEMASVHGAEVKTMRNFMTGTVDRYRPSYGHFAQEFPRQNIFICTINPEAGGYFADRTGNRRFWPIEMKRRAEVDKLVKVRDQLWAEARVLYDKKVPHWPDAKLLKLCEEQQGRRVQIEPWNEVVGEWLARGAPMRDESGMFMRERRVNTARGLTTSEVLVHALGFPPTQMNKGPAMRAAQVLKDLGFQHTARETHDGIRDRYYKPGAAVLTSVGGLAETISKQPSKKEVGQLKNEST